MSRTVGTARTMGGLQLECKLTCYQKFLSSVGEVDCVHTARVPHHVLRVKVVGSGEAPIRVPLSAAVWAPGAGDHAIQFHAT